MNHSAFTSRNGNRNGKREQGAAHSGARAQQHHNSSMDFLGKSGSRCRNMVERTYGGVYELVSIYLRARAKLGGRTVVGTGIGSFTLCFSWRRLRQRMRQEND